MTVLSRTLFALAACAGFLSPVVAHAQARPTASDIVLLGRTYHRSPTGTVPTSRFALILDPRRPSSQVLDVPADPIGGTGAYRLVLTAEPDGPGALLRWQLDPAAGSGLRAAKGKRSIDAGGLVHVELAQQGGERVHASVELGRGTDFDPSKLQTHVQPAPVQQAPPAYAAPRAFPVQQAPPPAPRARTTPPPVPSRMMPSPTVEAPRTASSPPPPSARLAPPPRSAARGAGPEPAPLTPAAWDGPTVAVPPAPSRPMRTEPIPAEPAPTALGPFAIDLEFRIEKDGVPVFAPHVTVRNGEAFRVVGGSPVEVTRGSLHDGLEITGTPRWDGRTIYMDLSVQTGRTMGRGGGAVYVVDRFRQGLTLAHARELVLDLFDDVAGTTGGRMRLTVTARVQ